MKKAIILVLDGVGIGELPDADAYGDRGAHTLGHVLATEPRPIENLRRLGIEHIEGSLLAPTVVPMGAYGKMNEHSPGKDTTTGHWEMSGVWLKKPFPVFPNGFPEDFIGAFEQAAGVQTMYNLPASGTEIIARLGEEHLKTGKLIVYTSADSVFQIAAHEGLYPIERQYEICRIARELLQGDLGVGRVIARPFTGEPGAFVRTKNRRDFSLPPPRMLLDVLCEGGLEVYGVGKIEDIFDHRGLTRSNHASGNAACMEATLQAMEEEFDGLLFVNLVDYDMVYGHRNDVRGFADALQAFDDGLGEVLQKMGPEDLLFITADHGCDPTFPGTDHTREYVPILAYGSGMEKGVQLGIHPTYADLSATVLAYFGLDNPLEGKSFLKMIKGEKDR